MGVDDCTQAVEASEPKLSTVAVDSEAVGRAAASALVGWIDSAGDDAPRQFVPTRYVERRSVCPPAKG